MNGASRERHVSAYEDTITQVNTSVGVTDKITVRVRPQQGSSCTESISIRYDSGCDGTGHQIMFSPH